MRKVLLGMGNPLGRDDALGLRLAERLQGSEWVAIPAQSLENAIGLARKLAPDLLVVVDAAEMGLPPGTIRRLPLSSSSAMLGSTHGLPLPLLLSLAGISEVILIGVQPKERGLGEGLSPEVEGALAQLTQLLCLGRLEEIPELLPKKQEEPRPKL